MSQERSRRDRRINRHHSSMTRQQIIVRTVGASIAAAAITAGASIPSHAYEGTIPETVADTPVVAKTKVMPLTSPITKRYTLTAHFGQSGHRWSSGQHTGLDFAASSGTPVLAADSGTVVQAEWEGAYGQVITIRHDNGLRTKYAHLSSMGVSTGDKVERGQSIGQVGSTGNSSGPHLHFEVLKGKQQVNPAKFLWENGKPPRKERKADR